MRTLTMTWFRIEGVLISATNDFGMPARAIDSRNDSVFGGTFLGNGLVILGSRELGVNEIFRARHRREERRADERRVQSMVPTRQTACRPSPKSTSL